MKILYLTGTRAEYGLMRRTLLELSRTHELSIIVTGSHLQKVYGYTIREIEKDGLPIWHKIKLPHAQRTVGGMYANQAFLESRLDTLLKRSDFDVCVVEGDRYEMLAMAKVAHKNGIPLIHQGGGDMSGGIDQRIRDEITALADVHVAGNEQSAERLSVLGIADDRICLFGEPGLDDITARDFAAAADIRKRYAIDPKRKSLLCIMHPDTTSALTPRRQIVPVLSAIRQMRMSTVIVYPNGDAGSAPMIKEIERLRALPYVHIYPSLSRADFLGLLNVCDVFIGNSSAGLTEASLLQVPFISLGDRQRGRARDANVVAVRGEASSIVDAIQANLATKGTFRLKHIYGKGHFTDRFLKLLKTYEKRNR